MRNKARSKAPAWVWRWRKRLMEAMQGALSYESVPGEGTTFWLDLPLTESPLVRAEVTDDDFPTPQAGAMEKTDRALSISRITCLTPVDRARVVTAASIDVTGRAQRRRRYQAGGEQVPDLILLYLNLPDMDGHECLAGCEAIALPLIR